MVLLSQCRDSLWLLVQDVLWPVSWSNMGKLFIILQLCCFTELIVCFHFLSFYPVGRCVYSTLVSSYLIRLLYLQISVLVACSAQWCGWVCCWSSFNYLDAHELEIMGKRMKAFHSTFLEFFVDFFLIFQIWILYVLFFPAFPVCMAVSLHRWKLNHCIVQVLGCNGQNKRECADWWFQTICKEK